MANQSAGDGLGLEASATKQKISQSKVTMSLPTECASGSSALTGDIENLSPATQESLGLLLRSISKGEARFDYNQSGKLVVDYKEKKKLYWDGSNANIIAKADSKVREKMDACLELIDYLKTEKPPSGVALDKTKVSMKHGRYREGHEFMKTKRILGSGNSAGDIIVVKDTTTGLEHAQKTMMISCFCKEEIRCWVDMSESGRVPALYLFTIHDNKVQIHMEILHDAKTLRSIMDDHMGNFYRNQEPQLVKPFSLYILDGALDSIQKLVHQGWTHSDLHAGNVMAQLNPEESLTVKILDFGSAQLLEPPMGLNFRGFQADIAEILRIFSGLYTGQEFDNKQDIQKNYQEKLKEIADFRQMGDDDRKELFCLVDAAMKVVHPDDLYSYREHVKDRLDNAMDSLGGEQIVMRKVAAILFPEKFQHVHQTAGQDAADAYIPANTDQVDENQVDDDDFVETSHDDHDHGDDQSDKMTSQPHDKMETDLDLVASQVTDDDLENLRSTLGVNI